MCDQNNLKDFSVNNPKLMSDQNNLDNQYVTNLNLKWPMV